VALALAALKWEHIDKGPVSVVAVSVAAVAAAVVRDSRSTNCQCAAYRYHCFQAAYFHSHVSFVGSKGYQSYVATHLHMLVAPSF
jgi:hypothetical protein